ncbi:MAG: hypothetical protein KJP02_03300, partial [Octadecabacter sp.]|nr:hypothetical protein [Octadecabacter sp.]
MRHKLSLALVTLCLASPALADISPGSYLAGRQAGMDADYAAASRYFSIALLSDAANADLQEQTLTALLGAGDVERAASIAVQFNAAGGQSQMSNMALMAHYARTENWDALFDLLEAGNEVGPLLDGLTQAWAYVGKGNMDRALQSFDEVIDTPGLRPFGLHHKALALALVGDLEGADAIYSMPANESFVPTRLTVVAHLRVLCALGEFDRAGEIFERAFGDDPDLELSLIRDGIAAREIPDVRGVTSAKDGVALAYLGLTDVLQGEANESYLLLHAQAAAYIAPNNPDTHIATARLLNALGQ